MTAPLRVAALPYSEAPPRRAARTARSPPRRNPSRRRLLHAHSTMPRKTTNGDDGRCRLDMTRRWSMPTSRSSAPVPRFCRYAISASCSVLPFSSSGALAISLVGVGHADASAARACLACDVARRRAGVFASHGYAGMFDSGTTSRGLSRCTRCQSSRVAAADARQIRPGALAAPLERVVVDEFAGDRVVAVALGLRAERPDHLRVAVVAAFAQVDVASGELQRRIGLDAGHRLGRRLLEEQRDDLDQAADADNEDRSARSSSRCSFRRRS